MGYIIKNLDDKEYIYWNSEMTDSNGIYIPSGFNVEIEDSSVYPSYDDAEEIYFHECYLNNVEIIEVKIIPTSLKIDLETLHPQFDIGEIKELKFDLYNDMKEYFDHLNVTEFEYKIVEV